MAPDIDYYELHMKVSEARENYTQQKDEEDEEGDIRRSLKFIKDKVSGESNPQWGGVRGDWG